MPLASIFHDHHRAVVQIGDALALLLAGLDDADCDLFARQERRFQGVRQVVEVDDLHVLELRATLFRL